MSPNALSLRFSALELLAALDFALGVGRFPLAPEDVGEDVMAQRGELAARIQGDSFPRELDRFVEMLLPVEIRLRQEQMTLREPGVDVDGAAKLPQLAFAV